MMYLVEEGQYSEPFDVISFILMMLFVRAMITVKRFRMATMMAEVSAVIVAIIIIIKVEMYTNI